ncbi:hypothetical protein [Corallococcus sp. AS-1-6]|uniref:hypothetical protein n=1 Tax=Corallococcus sp. AS-1-6 TaxID=2874599 RepID=UPI001CBAEC37|nr:hypothetical protein [Corallococcus sp. AS-1-6]MBZ4373333.1 hypothetical protein [Corallococcus sp. AS-1-6]
MQFSSDWHNVKGSLSCAWFSGRSNRELSASWHPDVFGERQSQSEKVEMVRREFALGGDGEKVVELGSPSVGLEVRIRSGDSLIVSRFVVSGRDLVMLQTVSGWGAVFSGGELFLDSLSVGGEVEQQPLPSN